VDIASIRMARNVLAKAEAIAGRTLHAPS